MIAARRVPTPFEKCRRAADPLTPPNELASYLSTDIKNRLHLQAARNALRNPSLPAPVLADMMLRPEADAWWNPAAPLVLMHTPSQAMVAAALTLFLFPARHLVRPGEPLERTMYLLQARLHTQTTTDRADLARHVATMFNFPWPVPRP